MDAANDSVGDSQRGKGPPPAPMNNPSNGAPPLPFLSKTYEIVDDLATDVVVSWGPHNNNFVVWNPPEFAQDLLPKFFKHSNVSASSGSSTLTILPFGTIFSYKAQCLGRLNQLNSTDEDMQPVENGWDKARHMDQLTQQTCILTSDNKRE